MANSSQLWSLWQKSKAVSTRPSQFLGLAPDTYEAYCFDEAVIFFGLLLESELEEAAEGKKNKHQRRAEAAQQRVLKRVFGDEKKGSGYADPALMFK